VGCSLLPNVKAPLRAARDFTLEPAGSGTMLLPSAKGHLMAKPNHPAPHPPRLSQHRTVLRFPEAGLACFSSLTRQESLRPWPLTGDGPETGARKETWKLDTKLALPSVLAARRQLLESAAFS
jgi:hypothetical protein